ncbi:transposase [Streptomyces sp. NBC_01795]|uniref:transposase n=1 Tax=unclassified Streptomyces TaxID=2593676 RepID=UPI002DD881FC|nr:MULTISPECIES: transposase [unclassified Streptomyces]WSA95423.1 transposase [Streptomyces sp. NBC_01795]WSS11953.1 transposase [Streptomyces sp. NBC_01186]
MCRRRLIDGIRRRARSGAPRRDRPAEYGPWQTVYGLFRRWQWDGTWAVVLTGCKPGGRGRADHLGDQLCVGAGSAARSRDPLHDPGAGRSGRPPQTPRNGRRTASGLRPCGLQARHAVECVINRLKRNTARWPPGSTNWQPASRSPSSSACDLPKQPTQHISNF